MANGKANTFWGLGTNQYGNPTPLTQGLMQIGQGLLAASSAPPAQRGAIYAQALDPTRMMQLRQEEEQQRAWEQIVKNATLPSGTETPQPQPMLGGYPTDVPGGPPGASQVAAVPGAPAESLAAPTPIKPRSGSLLDDNQRSLLMALGPNHPMSQAILMQAMTPAKPQAPLSAIGKLQADRAAGRISPEQYDQAIAVMMKPATQINLGQAQTPVGKITQDVDRGVLTPEEGERLKAKAQAYPQAQTDAASFANRMVEGDQKIDQLMAGGLDPTSLRGNVLSSIWGGNVMQTPEFQQYEQAKGDWIRAKLREESGAVISESEFEGEEKTYFPQIGDSLEAIQQKAEARRLATQNLIKESQGAYDELYAPKKPPMDPADYKGRTVRSDDGARYQSDGESWIRIE